MMATKTKPIDRKKISETLLADRLGLNEPWIDRWEENGEWKHESCAPERLPDFVRKDRRKKEVADIESEIDRLVKAGCRRQVVYFCVQQLSPEAERFRAGYEKRHILRNISARDGDEDYEHHHEQQVRLATREDMEAVANTTRAARKQIYRHQRELTLVAEAAKAPLPSGLMSQPNLVEDTLALLQDSLTWAATLADAYTAVFESTLLKSKGLLYLTLYVSVFADSSKLRGSRIDTLLRDHRKSSGKVRSRRTRDADNAMSSLAHLVTGTPWSPSELKDKLNGFKGDHPQLYKKLASKLTELHNLAAQ